MSLHFDELFRKTLQKVPHFVKKREKSSIWANFATFRTNYHVFAFRSTFQEKLAKSASFRGKTWKTIDLAKTCNFSRKLRCLGIFMNFSARSCKKCLISWKSTRNHRSGQIFITFRTNYHVFACRWTFQGNVAKSALFREKAREIIDLGKLCNFSNKLPCLCISINFSGKSCKKCLISWKSTKNHRFGQNFATFRTNYHVLAFRWTFQQKVAKSASFSWKSTKNHRFGQNFATFRTNYHVFAFRSTFQEKVAKSASFREKTRKTIDLAKTCNFSSKLPCLGIFVNFSERSCKKCLISWKSTRNHRFCQHYATFRTNYHVFAFRWTFKEKVGESGSFREKARKIMDLVKTCNFSNKLPCFGVSMNFSTKCCRNCLISWKSTKTDRFGQDYATFSNKLPCFGVAMNFSAKGCKKCLISWKSTRNHRSAKTLQLFEQLPCLCISMNFSGKSCKKCLISWKSTKNHRSGQNLATFRTNYHDFAFRWTFQKKVAKSASFREKTRKTIDLAKTCNFSRKLRCLGIFMNFSERSCKKCLISWKSTRNHRFRQKLQVFEKTTIFFRFDELYGKKLQKLPHFVKKHENSSIWPKLCNFFEQTTMFWCFHELLSKRLQKVAQFVRKHEKSWIRPKLCNFSNKLPCLCIWINFSGKSCQKFVISWKTTKTHRFGQNFPLFEQTTMSWHFNELLSKKLQKVPHSVEKHEKSSIWPKLSTFRANYHVLAF